MIPVLVDARAGAGCAMVRVTRAGVLAGSRVPGAALVLVLVPALVD